MGPKSKVLSEIKVKVVKEYLTGVKSMTQIAYEELERAIDEYIDL